MDGLVRADTRIMVNVINRKEGTQNPTVCMHTQTHPHRFCPLFVAKMQEQKQTIVIERNEYFAHLTITKSDRSGLDPRQQIVGFKPTFHLLLVV